MVDHDGTIEIHWPVYIFPWQQPESTTRVCPFDVREGIRVLANAYYITPSFLAYITGPTKFDYTVRSSYY